jgi:hypothetical protein
MLDVELAKWRTGENLPMDCLSGQLGGMAHPFEWPPTRRKRKTVTTAADRVRSDHPR